MRRLLSIILPLLAGTTSLPAAASPPAAGIERQCWEDTVTAAEKQQLVARYQAIRQRDGEVAARAWVNAQMTAFSKRAEASGACRSARAPAQQQAPSDDRQILNREGKPCRRIEMENQNVPNLGGAMGWALIPVCKD